MHTVFNVYMSLMAQMSSDIFVPGFGFGFGEGPCLVMELYGP